MNKFYSLLRDILNSLFSTTANTNSKAVICQPLPVGPVVPGKLTKSQSLLQKAILSIALIISIQVSGQSGPELVFKNPVLVSGQANKQGALYRFSNITPGVDAEVKLKRFSRSDIVMISVDLATAGWEKAFQPNFGLSGLVLPLQNWYVDFEMTFFEAGKSTKKKMDTVDLTALDVDGDGHSISEYVTYDNPSLVSYSTISYLANTAAGALGQSFECGDCHVSSILVSCSDCGGDGITNSGNGNNNECEDCEGSGKVHDACDHPYSGGTGSTVLGPITNFLSIDTLATQVMATYTFLKTDRIKFRYGAKSSLLSSNGSGIRLNSTWFREFSLTPPVVLPVKLIDFSAKYNKSNVTLSWATAMEKNFNHFEVEQSTDGINFTSLATIFGNGESENRQDYTYIDKNLAGRGGLIYYRLRMVDIGGKQEFSPIRIIRIGEDKQLLNLTTYPNPVVNDLRITIPAKWQGKTVKIEMFNNNGQRVKSLTSANGTQTEVISVQDLGKGFYTIKAVCGEETAQQKVIKN